MEGTLVHLAERRRLSRSRRLEQIVARGFEEFVQLRADAVPAIHQQNGTRLSAPDAGSS